LEAEHSNIVLTSALTGDGIDLLCQRIRTTLLEHMWSGEEIVITRRRHYECLLRCSTALEQAAAALTCEDPLELVASELRAAASALEELTGKVYDEEILNRIFGEFCIGK
jgi:tRNA modification GTPase